MDCALAKGKLMSLVLLSALSLSFGVARTSHGQSLRYIDSSGNVRFADSIKEVPREYREQIYPATPTPVLTRQQQMQRQMQQDRIQKDKLRAEQMKRMERDRRAADIDKAARRKRNDLRQDELSSGFAPGAF